MKRREFIAGLGSAAWPPAARAQQAGTPVIGFLFSGRPPLASMAALRQGLASIGYAEGDNVVAEYRFAEGQLDRLPILAVELVRRRVAVIAPLGGSDSAQAAKNATTDIPIVFAIGNDPVQTGLVASLNRPGGNITGVTGSTREVQNKRLAMMRELLPNGSLIATFSNPISVVSDVNLRDLELAAASLGQQLLVLRASSNRELEEGFDSIVQKGAGALFLNANPFFASRRDLIVALAARHRIPTIFSDRAGVAAGGLMSYGSDFIDAYRQAGTYIGRVLKGEKPGDLPVVQPTKFEFVINLKTAKALGIKVSPQLLALADEVIE